MEKLVRHIKSKVGEIGSFETEYALDKGELKFKNGKIDFIGVDFIRVAYDDNTSECMFYNSLDFDTLLDIFNVVMMYTKKLKYYENYILNKNKRPVLQAFDI
jgi:hypothetical protein